MILGTFLMAISHTQGHKAAPEIFLVQKELPDRATPEEIEEQVSSSEYFCRILLPRDRDQPIQIPLMPTNLT